MPWRPVVVVVVAGAGPGIGASIARSFGAEGFGVALLARNSTRLSTHQAELAAAGIPAAAFIVDLSDSAATQDAVERVRSWAGRDPSSLVYNALTVQQGLADQLDLAESERAMRVNFIAATQLTSLAAPAMRASRTGSLLFTGGGAAWDEREPSFILWGRHFPQYRSMHADPRFAAILREMDS